MSGFKRFLYVLYFVVAFVGVGIVAIAALSNGPLSLLFTSLLAESSFLIGEIVLLAVVLVGLVAILVKAIVTPRSQPVLRSETPLGTVSVTQRKLEDSVRETIERHDELEFGSARVYITNGETPTTDVDVVVVPIGVDNLSTLGPSLQAEIKAQLEKLTGSSVGSIAVTFSELTRRVERKRESGDTVESSGETSAAKEAADSTV